MIKLFTIIRNNHDAVCLTIAYIGVVFQTLYLMDQTGGTHLKGLLNVQIQEVFRMCPSGFINRWGC